MNTVFVPAAAVLLLGLTQLVAAGPPANEHATRLPLQKKFLGTWEGRTPCAGTFLFRADGTYKLTGHGPGLCDSAGTWKLRTDTLPTTLVLTCKTSDVADEVGQISELKLIRLDDENLAVKHAGQDVARYERAKK